MPILNNEGQLVSHELGYCVDCKAVYVIGARDDNKCPKHQDELLPVDATEEWFQHWLATCYLCTECGILMYKKILAKGLCWGCNSEKNLPVKELFDKWPPAVASDNA